MSRRGTGARRPSKPQAFNPQAVSTLFESFLTGEPDEDPTVLDSEQIVMLAQAVGIQDPADPRVLVLMWKLGARKRPQHITKEEFEAGMRALECDSLEKLRRLVPTLDVDFIQGSEFRDFYRFVFTFSLEGTRRNLEKEMVVGLLPMVMGQRSEFTGLFTDFLNQKLKDTELISGDQWSQFLEFSQTYGNLAALKEGYQEDGAWPVLLDEFVEYLRKK